jgi:Protein of unknown function (DUF3617)
MRRPLALVGLALIFAVPAVLAVSAAAAEDWPTRKPGLWEIHMTFVGRKLPAQTIKQCIDAATDKLMNSQYGSSTEHDCSKRDIKHAGATMTVDSVCNISGATTTSHAEVIGSFDSAYTMDVTSTREGGRPIPGMAAGGATHMKLDAKWLGPCAAGQKPGDMMMANGMTINVLEMQKLRGKMQH